MLAVVVHQVAFSTGRSAGNDFLAALLGRLDVGIAICFVLSGFLMYQPFALYQAPGAVGPSVVRFWQRRAIRIVPALWLTVAVTFALTERSESVADWLRHVVLIQAVDFRYINVYLSHLWSISVLVGFCILVPVVGTIAATGARDATSAERRHLAVVGLWFCVAVAVQHPAKELGSRPTSAAMASRLSGLVRVRDVPRGHRVGSARCRSAGLDATNR